jgi:hypothetical protein
MIDGSTELIGLTPATNPSDFAGATEIAKLSVRRCGGSDSNQA